MTLIDSVCVSIKVEDVLAEFKCIKYDFINGK